MQQTIEQWVGLVMAAPLPVLARSVAELARLREHEDRITARHIASVVLHDPIMTVKVLCYLQQHRSKRQSTDITTIDRALMMLGLTPFFEHFGIQDTIEARFSDDSNALQGARGVMWRARLAALYAHDWAQLRHDIDPEEIMLAALLHDLAEMLLWCFAPELALEIDARRRHDPSLRSAAAQVQVLGFPLIELQLAVVKAWQLPSLLHLLGDDRHIDSTRVLNVVQATAIARHSSRGWSNAALPYDYAVVGRLLGLPHKAIEQRVMDVAQKASHDSEWYGIPGDAAAAAASGNEASFATAARAG